jgi:hypothetical protein
MEFTLNETGHGLLNTERELEQKAKGISKPTIMVTLPNFSHLWGQIRPGYLFCCFPGY